MNVNDNWVNKPEQSGAPSHKYWIDIQRPSPGQRNGSYGWQASMTF